MVPIPYLSLGLVLLSYPLWKLLGTLPFNYITQTDIHMCKGLDGSFCSRLSYFLAAILVYVVYIYVNNNILETQKVDVKNALLDRPANALQGITVGTLIAVASIVLNIIFGFITVKGLKTSQFAMIPAIVLGMLYTGFSEELIFRAIPINALTHIFNKDTVVWITALIFGYIHSGSSLYYAFSAFVAGLLLGYGFLKYGLYWAVGLHTSYNIVETVFFTLADYKVKNTFMAGKRETPDDDGNTTSLITIVLLILQRMNITSYI